MSERLVLSLFPGLGLLDRAFEEEGFCVVRGPDPLWGGDVRLFHPPPGRFDGVIGGPPCQSFSSLVHLVRANGHEPRFGNLIPEFERCVKEAKPDWFLMENVPQAPEPVVSGYGVKSFLLDNSSLESGDGFGQEQRRVRRFSFGLRGQEPPSLLRWIEIATFFLPDAVNTVFGDGRPTRQEVRNPERFLQPPVTHGTGFPHDEKFKTRQVTVTSTDATVRPSEKRTRTKSALSGSNGGNGKERIRPGAGNQGKGRYKLADACRLQGLPEDFLADAPFTSEGKLKAVANGVPLPMGRAIAKAVLEALKTGG